MPTTSPLQAWLNGLGLDKHLQILLDNDVALDLVAELSDADLRELGFSLGDRKRFLKGAKALGQPAAATPAIAEPWSSPETAAGVDSGPGR